MATPKKTIEDFIALTTQISHYGNQGPSAIDFLQEVSLRLLAFFASDALELRLRDAEGQPYLWKARLNEDETLAFEHFWHQNRNDHFVFRSPKDDAVSVRIYQAIADGNVAVDCSLPGESESWWLGQGEVVVRLKKPISGVKTLTISPPAPYRSLVILPFFIEDSGPALLHFKSKRRNYFRRSQLENYRGLAQSMGLAIADRRRQFALRERIKELTCLCQIDAIVAQSEKTVAENLHSIVALLPPGWQYPEITTARITFDGKHYRTVNFREGKYRQSADIIIHGQYRGAVDIFYTQRREWFGVNPFLIEEQKLLETVADRLALIIERCQAREEKSELQEQLRHADRLATIGQLAAGVAHELNEPLSNILGFAQLAKKSEGLPTQTLRDIEKIENASLFAREVVKKLLIFARGMPVQKSAINLNEIVEKGLYFESRCARQGVRLHYALQADLPKIVADAGQMTQVLINLVVNAFQAMPDGGDLTISTGSDPDKVWLLVVDTGIGMSVEVQRQIFLPFYTTKDVDEGTGLGLAVVHGIVGSHGGDIEVTSEVGRGASLKIRFPRPDNKK